MDWVGIKASYRANYAWDAASLSPSALSLGNIIRNGQNRQINGDLDFEKLYNYSKYLKSINSKRRPGRGGSRGGGRGGARGGNDSRGKVGNDKDTGGGLAGGGGRKGKNDKNDPSSAESQDKGKGGKKGGFLGRGKRNQIDPSGGITSGGKAGKSTRQLSRQRDPSKIERALIRPLMAIRKLRLTYQEDFSTVVPGYLPNSDFLGMNSFDSPGWDFVAGLQPKSRRPLQIESRRY